MQILDGLSQAYGGTHLLAKRLGVHFTRVYAWKRDGVIPLERLLDVVDAAQEKGVEISPADLLPDEVLGALEARRRAKVGTVG
jgi:hypothetical protein